MSETNVIGLQSDSLLVAKRTHHPDELGSVDVCVKLDGVDIRRPRKIAVGDNAFEK